MQLPAVLRPIAGLGVLPLVTATGRVALLVLGAATEENKQINNNLKPIFDSIRKKLLILAHHLKGL